MNDQPIDTSFLRLYAETRGFMLGRPAKPKFSPDGKTVFFLRSEAKNPKQKLFAFDVESKKTKELLTPEMLLGGKDEQLSAEEKARRERQRITAGGFADYHLSPDGSKILVSLSGRLFVFDRATEKHAELKTGPGSCLDPKWSPDGKMVGYVRGFDVYALDLASGKETAVTTGGTSVKTNGLAEFVAQEEMGRHSGFWWSPDSKQIAFAEADHTGVEQWAVADPLNPDKLGSPQYYPRPGKKNVSVRLGIATIDGTLTKYFKLPLAQGARTTHIIDINPRKEHPEAYEYLLRVNWHDDKVILIVQTRDQRDVGFYYIYSKCLEAKLDGRWIRGSDWHNVPTEQKFSANTDLPICMLNDLNGGDHAIAFFGSGYSGVTQAHAYFGILPNNNGHLFGHSDNPTEMHVHLLKNASGKKQLSTAPGIHSASMSDNGRAFVLTSTTLETMPQSVVIENDTEIASLISVSISPVFKPTVATEKVDDYFTAIVKPKNFDPTKKYPVIVDVYGGPGHLHVVQAMKNWLIPQWLADQGFIVVAIDNRGTPGRGRDWERAIYQKFGTVPLEDQVKGLHALAAKHPQMDLSHVGIVGWSFGGYMAANAVLRRPDVFHAAVAGAPVTDWEDYDTHYTERYLGVLPESRKAYDEASLIPLAKDLKRPLLLIHGTADDNVYYRHTLKLSDAIFRAGKTCEVLPLPGVTHMYTADPQVAERMWERTVRFFKRELGGVK